MGKTVIVRSNLKYYAKVGEKQIFIAGDFADRLQEKVVGLIEDACKRAMENQRNTVMGRDL